ncbi:MAG: hypothetical protein GWM89_07395 [Candidatus Dadabacteria bacterium]|nr:hypothetical protein [Candidatus Dadabacteria bacterium]NIV42593.1 hypothetical protein [Candidatus Dadabacteria bacterium]NIY22237.1 hypothetical protein [Candidatus Dadabacteria bacterium]
MKKRKSKLLFIISVIAVLYICSYLLAKSQNSRASSVGTSYILLEQDEPSQIFMHYFFYPAFWVDYKLTGQEYGISKLEHPYWIFAD